MAVRHRLIQASPRAVWDVLADGDLYVRWVVGPSKVVPKSGPWPRVGATIAYEVRLGPLRLNNESVVRHCVEGSQLELEAKAGRLGTARIAIELRPWGEQCLLIVDEHPLRGPGGLLHNVGLEAFLQVRHRAMLARLAELCESQAGDQCRPDPANTAGSVAFGPGAGRA
ncbi:SRPBCC family protein [Streptomyces sp. AC627_RSS907]|uniref:SRPBCC family protein n=1 Tax=Streptomyces sp. AC627_RSS907 TaxID=2823684 RepID=UPI001C21422D|nr:SRPBCC family protein [Streptomyces sp. AC627_RSS907]